MTMTPAADPLALTGTWTFERVISDHAAHEEHHVTGTTELVAEGPDRVRWSESGVMAWRDTEIPVSRTLFLTLRDDGWFVTFDDGRDFHPWTPQTEVEHLCGNDLYVGRIDVLTGGPARWTVEWNVTGPAKNYTMTTVLTRGS